MVKEITKEELSHGRKSDCLVEFYTPTCAFCKEMEKTLVAVAEEKPDARIYKMDVSEAPEVAKDLGIRSVPTLIRFQDGEILHRTVGKQSKDTVFQLLQ